MSNKKIIYSTIFIIILVLIFTVLNSINSVTCISIILLILLPIVLLIEFSPKIKNLLIKRGFKESFFATSLCGKLGMISIVLCYLGYNGSSYNSLNLILSLIGFLIASVATMILIQFNKIYGKMREINFLLAMNILAGIFNMLNLFDILI